MKYDRDYHDLMAAREKKEQVKVFWATAAIIVLWASALLLGLGYLN
jgi:hypothetical protein